MPSDYQNTEFRKIRKRVLAAIPNWYKWPRILRQLLTVLPDIGGDELAIEDWCIERSYDYERLQEHLNKNPDAEAAVAGYRATGELPRLPQWRNPLTKAHLQILVSESEVFGQYLDLVAMKGGGQSGRMNLEAAARMGLTEAGDPLDEQPEIQIMSGDRAVGINIGKEEMEQIREGDEANDAVAALSNWDLGNTAAQEQYLP